MTIKKEVNFKECFHIYFLTEKNEAGITNKMLEVEVFSKHKQDLDKVCVAICDSNKEQK